MARKKKQPEKKITVDLYCDLKGISKRTRSVLMKVYGKEINTVKEWEKLV